MNSPVAWALVFHIVGFVFWMTGLLVTTVALGLHAREESDEGRRVLERLEVRMLRGFAAPGAVITILAGITVVSIQPGYIHQHWLQAKLFLVAILIGLHVIVYLRTRTLHVGERLEARTAMILHGVISLVFLGIVILVLIKPF